MPLQQRLALHAQQGLRGVIGQGAHTLAPACGQNHGLRCTVGLRHELAPTAEAASEYGRMIRLSSKSQTGFKADTSVKG